jgi:hypothetical protein
MMAGAAFFSPHASQTHTAKRNQAPATLQRQVPTGTQPLVTTSETFQVSPDFEIDAIIAEAAEKIPCGRRPHPCGDSDGVGL